MPLLAALAALAAPILSRVLIALGFAAVTFVGVVEAINLAKSNVLMYLGAAPQAGLQLAGLAGVWVGLGMIFGALTFTVTMWGLAKAVRIAKA